jgi:K+-transporting ATPase A subunit
MLVSDSNYSWPATTSDNQKNAEIELANFLLTNPDYQQSIQLAQSGIQSFTIGTFSQSYKGDKELSTLRTQYPIQVLNYIEQYRVNIPAVARVKRKVRTDGYC